MMLQAKRARWLLKRSPKSELHLRPQECADQFRLLRNTDVGKVGLSIPALWHDFKTFKYLR